MRSRAATCIAEMSSTTTSVPGFCISSTQVWTRYTRRAVTEHFHEGRAPSPKLGVGPLIDIDSAGIFRASVESSRFFSGPLPASRAALLRPRQAFRMMLQAGCTLPPAASPSGEESGATRMPWHTRRRCSSPWPPDRCSRRRVRERERKAIERSEGWERKALDYSIERTRGTST